MNYAPKIFYRIILILLLPFPAIAQVELHYEDNRTPGWEETIEMYRWLDENYEEARLMEIGLSDAGRPLHLFIISLDACFTAREAREEGKTVLFINNGIHPGEPCGVDASLELARGLLSGKDQHRAYLENTVLLIVPILNVGGSLNRSPYHRANQNGPEEHGFRGNARNLDLNRDFVKMDALNTRSLVQVIREWEPELFVDTHTSNGADYPYVITLINSHTQRHEKAQARFLEEELKPWLFRAMKNTPYEMSPYVWSYGRSPDTGIVGFMDYPRYTSGYASLYNSLAFTVETHMFKDYADRVLSTWHLLRAMLQFSSTYQEEIMEAKARAWEEKMERETFVLQWTMDTSRFDMIHFKGYEARTSMSKVTGHPRLYYDRDSPWEKDIPYYNYFEPLITRSVPAAYIIPSAWREVIGRLEINGVEMSRLEQDTTLEVEVYYIDSYESYPRPYNGHYMHYNVELRKETQALSFLKGDYFIPGDQKAREYLVQTLEPDAHDSFFAWNFFDEILFRNEYFSSYIFEETAEELLRKDPQLKKDLRQKVASDPDFASNPRAQLNYIYERSPWSEPTYMRYPVYRINAAQTFNPE